MADNTESGGGVIEELTPEELKVLSKALKRVETDIFNRLLRRLSVFIGLILSILLIGGLVNLSSCSSNVENNASQKLASDPELRDKIVNNTQASLKDIQDKLQRLNEEAAEIERQNARATANSVDDLAQIRLMIERINNELSNRLQSEEDSSPSRKEKK